jgi:glutamyl-Q tRNA(Asp) synthetase
MAVVTRFAPSPTGPLHLGHAYAAIIAHDMARRAGGQFLLRIEDIDQSRCRTQWETQIFEDLEWLGLKWDGTPLRQSNQMSKYSSALNSLGHLTYLCTCTRRDIEYALSAPQEGSVIGPDGPVYPGTCRYANRTQGVVRLNVANVAKPTNFKETGPEHAGQITTSAGDYTTNIGDIVLARRDLGTSYHLSVVLDDAAAGITHVTRGSDLFDATRIHVLLQDVLGLPRPIYHHHPLIRDDQGKRLAKRDDARALSRYRSEGATPIDIRRMVGL